MSTVFLSPLIDWYFVNHLEKSNSFDDSIIKGCHTSGTDDGALDEEEHTVVKSEQEKKIAL